ncbi:MAG: uncharacterized protein JWO98_741 [Frankiales bacterium]|nr:uncharacterized protein [Frankiales bacterium]
MTAPPSTLDMTDGGGHDSGDVEGNRRLLSVAEIQQVLRELRARGSRPVAAGIGATSQRPENRNSQPPPFEGERVPPARRPRRTKTSTPAQDWGDTGEEGPARGGDIAAGNRQHAAHGGELEAGWIGILAAHAGAGASTAALVICDAAAAGGRRVHLVDTAQPSRSGLVAAASEELGLDVTGAWHRGLRTGVTIDRRATDTAPGRWPISPVGDDPALTVVDLGLAAPEKLTRLVADRGRPVVVCRPTVPGVRLTEQLLAQVAGQSVVVAAVGLTRWPGEVTASLGPRLHALRADGRVVPVPMNRRLQVTGPTSSPLPRPLHAAGRSLLELLDDTHPGAATRSLAPTTRPVPTPEDTRR